LKAYNSGKPASVSLYRTEIAEARHGVSGAQRLGTGGARAARHACGRPFSARPSCRCAPALRAGAPCGPPSGLLGRFLADSGRLLHGFFAVSCRFLSLSWPFSWPFFRASAWFLGAFLADFLPLLGGFPAASTVFLAVFFVAFFATCAFCSLSP